MARKNTKKAPVWKVLLNILIALSFIFYLCMLFYWTLGGYRLALVLQGEAIGAQHLYRLEPFATISHYWNLLLHVPYMRGIAFRNLFGNVVLVLPLAIYLPYFFRKMRHFWVTLPVILLIVLAIEGLQYATGLGSCDTDDVILNMAGAVIGYIVWALPPVQTLVKKIEP